MRVIQTPVRLFTAGGVERYVLCLSKELARMGHRVTVVCAGSLGDKELYSNICVRPLRSIGKIANTDITPGLPLTLLRENFDILHTHIPTPWSADWSSAVSLLKDRPLVLSYHSDIVGSGGASYLAKAYNSTGLKLLLEAADKIIVARRNYLSKHLEGFVDKIVEVPIGVDGEAFKPVDTERIGDVFFLSVLDEFHTFKGLEVLLSALTIVKREMAGVKLVIGGGGRLKDHYISLGESMGLRDNVEFAGFIPEERLRSYYNGCRLFVLPSIDPARETFGIVLLEAMACGRPVVTTDIAGMAEDLRKHGAGLVVGRDRPQELARAMTYLLQNEKQAAEMGASGRRLVEQKYSWPRIARQIEEIYQELI